LAKKTLKLVGETNAELVISPPRPLGKHGMQLWTAVHRQYDVGECAALIAEQGELIHTRNGPKRIRSVRSS
jgi:hypothetical protein